jgi:general secretion pathway protein C
VAAAYRSQDLPTRLNLRIEHLFLLVPLVAGLGLAYALSGLLAGGGGGPVARPASSVAAAPVSRGGVKMIYDANVLGLELPEGLQSAQGPEVGDPSDWAVLGTFVGSRSLAMVLVDGVTTVLFVGESVKGWELFAVKPDRLIWQHDADARVVMFGEGDRIRKAAAARSDGGATLSAGKTTRIDVSRAEAEPVLKDPTILLQQALFKPFLRDGKVVGFSIRNIQPGSILKTLGMENGDVLVRINGEQITGPQGLLKLYSGLAGAKSVSLDLERNGLVLPVLVEVK